MDSMPFFHFLHVNMTTVCRNTETVLVKTDKMKKHLYFCEKQVDSFALEWYTPNNLKT